MRQLLASSGKGFRSGPYLSSPWEILPATYSVGPCELMALTRSGGSGWAMRDKGPPRTGVGVWACAGAGSAAAVALKAARADPDPLRSARRVADGMMNPPSVLGGGWEPGRTPSRAGSAPHHRGGTIGAVMAGRSMSPQ